MTHPLIPDPDARVRRPLRLVVAVALTLTVSACGWFGGDGDETDGVPPETGPVVGTIATGGGVRPAPAPSGVPSGATGANAPLPAPNGGRNFGPRSNLPTTNGTGVNGPGANGIRLPASSSTAPNATTTTTTPTRTPGVEGPNPTQIQNGSSALETLKAIATAQRECRKQAVIDEDYDGLGEYGGLVELSGSAGGRMERPLRNALLPRRLGQLNNKGEYSRGGYLYRVYLPGKGGAAIGESARGFGTGQFDPNLAEDFWCVYAWPADRSGGRTYFLGQDGDILVTDDARYGGRGRGPKPGAALRSGGLGGMLGLPAAGSTGQDQNAWRIVR